ncbi:hypothetical protein J6590_019178 [Homalodisca vitripennis]|nr:hypothetical protein J6590_019178 [Homalodisca vitripennis]
MASTPRATPKGWLYTLLWAVRNSRRKTLKGPVRGSPGTDNPLRDPPDPRGGRPGTYDRLPDRLDPRRDLRDNDDPLSDPFYIFPCLESILHYV